MTKSEKFTINGTDLSSIHNRNEERVVKTIVSLLASLPDVVISSNDLQDIYAISLNAIPPRYTQTGTIVLRDPVQQEQLTKVVREAFKFVISNPRK